MGTLEYTYYGIDFQLDRIYNHLGYKSLGKPGKNYLDSRIEERRSTLNMVVASHGRGPGLNEKEKRDEHRHPSLSVS